MSIYLLSINHFKETPMKEPKAGEVWSFNKHSTPYTNPGALYHIIKVEDGIVYHRALRAPGMSHLHRETIKRFISTNTFVF